ncbi:MAG TPA: hypothetical protein VFL27_07735 [Candidatus Dormibacteraeota bacterium]|nr:hypothetical protein [Candidatus Dormibacteraeota bacterium]
MLYLLAGPLVALVGIGAVFFVLRHKSEEKRSMYSARRQQIEHKVKAARQRTLAPHGHAPKHAEQTAMAPQASPFEQQQAQPTVAYQYQAPAYEAPPVAPPPAPAAEPAPSGPMPWETTSAPAAAAAPATSWDFPPATTMPPEPAYTPPAAPEPFRPAPEPTPMAPSEPAWTPAPKPAEPLAPAQTVAPAASATAAGSWEIVSSPKDSAATTAAPEGGKKKKGKSAEAASGSSWSLASGDAPGAEADDESESRRPSGTIVAVAQYAVLVVGLVMVLIGVLVMVANSHVT